MSSFRTSTKSASNSSVFSRIFLATFLIFPPLKAKKLAFSFVFLYLFGELGVFPVFPFYPRRNLFDHIQIISGILLNPFGVKISKYKTPAVKAFKKSGIVRMTTQVFCNPSKIWSKVFYARLVQIIGRLVQQQQVWFLISADAKRSRACCPPEKDLIIPIAQFFMPFKLTTSKTSSILGSIS